PATPTTSISLQRPCVVSCSLDPYTTLFRSALRVGVASHFDAQVGVTLQDLDRLVEDRHRVGTQGRLVEVEVHALQVDRHRHRARSEEHTSELQSREKLVCRLLLGKKNTKLD